MFRKSLLPMHGRSAMRRIVGTILFRFAYEIPFRIVHRSGDFFAKAFGVQDGYKFARCPGVPILFVGCLGVPLLFI